MDLPHSDFFILAIETSRYLIHLLFLGVLGVWKWITFKKAEMKKNLRNGFSLSEPQMVGFRKIVVVGIAPVSKITAVKHELVHSFPFLLFWGKSQGYCAC